MKPKLFAKIRCFAGEMKAKKMIASFALVLLAIYLSEAQGMKPNKTVSTTVQVNRGVEGNKRSRALAQAPTAARPEVLKAYGKLPLSFEANQGQTDSQVKFLSRGSGYSLFLTNNQAVLLLKRPEVSKTRKQPHTVSATAEPTRAHAIAASVLRIKLVAANPATKTVGLDELAGKSNYLIGNDPQKWRTNVPNYARVQYREIYPGVDLVYYGNQGQLEHDFVVAPGGNPKIITMRFEGDRGHKLAANGDLVLSLNGGEVRLQKPHIYQEVGVVEREVEAGYVLKGKRQVGFAVAAYDTTQPLVIDPVLSYSTYLGGTDFDAGEGIALDSSGNAYVTSATGSTNFPTTPGAFQTTYGGGVHDAFVTKLNPTGTALVYSTYLGGSGEDQGSGIAVDSSGNAYMTGLTNSTNFPTTPGAFQTMLAGNFDTFVTKLNPTGSALLYSTYIGGTNFDQGTKIAVDSLGNAYVTGLTQSTNLPTTLGAFQTAYGGGQFDAFVTKINPTGSALVYSTYLGGNADDRATSIALDSSGNAYVTGFTGSTNFPTTLGAFQTTFGGGSLDAFVTKLNPSGTALVYSTYLGGSSTDVGNGIALDSLANAYVTGYTNSTNFPTTPGAFQTTYGGGSNDAFVTKLNSTGSALVYSTFLGDNGDDEGFGIAVDSSGNAYVTGETSSTNFPTTPGAFQTTYGGGQFDAFATKLNSTGTALVYSTYLGGSSFDNGYGIAVDSSGNAYVTGQAGSTNFPTTPGAFQTTFGGGTFDAFVAKISDVAIPATLTLTPAAATNTVGTTHCVTAMVKDALGNPVPNVTVVFSVPTAVATHASPASGSVTTDANGQAIFCYSASLPGQDTIHAFADTNGDGNQDVGEPFGDATKTWTPPVSTAFCEVTITNGGWIVADNTDRANFGGNAKVSADGSSVQGQEEYQDKGPVRPLNMHSIKLTATTCSGDLTTATIFGTATIDGSGSHVFRIDVSDAGSPGTNDTYGIVLDTGYISGQKRLQGGNVTIHK